MAEAGGDSVGGAPGLTLLPPAGRNCHTASATAIARRPGSSGVGNARHLAASQMNLNSGRCQP